MDERPTRMPPPEQVMSPDPEPVGVEFLAELPEHVRAFFDEQHKLYSPKWTSVRFCNRHVSIIAIVRFIRALRAQFASHPGRNSLTVPDQLAC